MKKQDRLGKALDHLYEVMIAGDKDRQAKGRPLLWGEKDWWEQERHIRALRSSDQKGK